MFPKRDKGEYIDELRAEDYKPADGEMAVDVLSGAVGPVKALSNGKYQIAVGIDEHEKPAVFFNRDLDHVAPVSEGMRAFTSTIAFGEKGDIHNKVTINIIAPHPDAAAYRSRWLADTINAATPEKSFDLSEAKGLVPEPQDPQMALR